MNESLAISEHRFGRSPFRLSLLPEEHGMSTSLRCAIIHKPARAGKNNLPVTVLDVTPRRPLFSLMIGGETYPLLIDEGVVKRGGKVILSGQRKVGPSRKQTVTWSAHLTPRIVDDLLLLDCRAQFRCSPPERRPARLQIRLGCSTYQPQLLTERTAQARCTSAASAWSERNRCTLSLVFPNLHASDAITWDGGGLLAAVPEIDLRGRTPVRLSLALSVAKSCIVAQDALRWHFVESVGLALPPACSDQDALQDTAHDSVTVLTRPEAHDIVGKQRIYLRAPGFDSPKEHRYAAGFPHFAVDAAVALMTWNKFHPDEAAARLAEQISRGVAADFAVISTEQGSASNKGAFWDIATVNEAARVPLFSDDKGTKTHSLISSTRIALALFEMFGGAGDPLFRQAALNACHWLMLKQTDTGYFRGERVCGTSGQIQGNTAHFAGIGAIRPMVAAFRTTGNEVFIKAAWKIAKHVLETILPPRDAPCLIGDLPEHDCPLALACAIEALSDLHDEATNKDLKAALLMLGRWLAACDFTAPDRACLNYDGAWGGLIDCAFAALRLHGLERDPLWLRLGHELLRAVPPAARQGWRGVEIYTHSLLSLAAILPDARVQFQKLTVQVGWQTYVPDASAGQYLSVRACGTSGRVDLLPLVCRQTDQALVFVLADSHIERVEILQSNRKGMARLVMRDLVQDALVSGDVTLTPLPYAGADRAGLFRIDP